MVKTKGKTKIYMVAPHELHSPEPFIIGFCGTASDIIDVMDFYEHPENYKRFPTTRNLSGLVLTLSGSIFQFDSPGKWLAVDNKFAAMGSGSPAAYGALHSGATPKQAVLAAGKVDPYTGMGTKLLSFSKFR
jgi:hypothetical protein